MDVHHHLDQGADAGGDLPRRRGCSSGLGIYRSGLYRKERRGQPFVLCRRDCSYRAACSPILWHSASLEFLLSIGDINVKPVVPSSSTSTCS
jgi:hypothetical protein